MSATPQPLSAASFRRALLVAMLACAVLCLLWLVDDLLDLRLHVLGIYPGRLSSLPAIVTAPLIHGSFSHLLANTLPLLIMLTILLYAYPRSAAWLLPVLWLGSGLIVWSIGRPAWHFGASGLTHGLMFFLFVIGVLRRDRVAAAMSMTVFFLYGSMVWGVFPREPGISYEYHLAGALIGVLMAFVLRHRDPPAPQKTYDWEGQDGEDELFDADDGRKD